MNYYEHHIGDYAEATAHLTFIEDAAYSRMIRKYYSQEKPLPPDLAAVQRLVGARTKEEKAAVETVLGEFFYLEPDGFHNDRCDDEIAKFLAGKPERDLKKANETNRLKRHREERAKLFKALTDAGLHAPWNIGMNELRAMVETLPATKPATPETPPATAPETPPETPPATAPATPATATHTPDTRHQTPELTGIPPTPPKPKAFDPVQYLTSKGVDEGVARDWLKARKLKDLAPTETAFRGVEREAEKAGLTMARAIQICCENGWGGFKAEWIANASGGSQGQLIQFKQGAKPQSAYDRREEFARELTGQTGGGNG